jgi:predicted ATPase/transcriptional regulator with XRE-family HTH domain
MDHSFGTWIKHRRKTLDLTQQELADRVGCSLSLIFKIESDERRPSRQIAGLLAEHLAIPSEKRSLFMQIARRERGTTNLEAIPTDSDFQVDAVPVAPQSSLPVYLTSLVGREFELGFVCQQLQDQACRLLTLTGPGGVGKTRLAVEAARKLTTEFSDGVFFLPMSGVGLAEAVLPLLADVLGLAFSGPLDPKSQILHHVRKKELLLVFDNMEHLLATAGLLAEMLQVAAGLKILLTSREPMHLQGEWIFEVQGLPILEQLDTAGLERNSAAALFLQRARQTSLDFTLSTADHDALVQICKSVDGLPLAIELAAAWVRVLSLPEIAAELECGLDLLESRLQDVSDRHRSIKTVIEHSWNMLSDEEAAILTKLGVFSARFTRPAAEAVAGASLFSLSSLLSKSLLRYNSKTDRYDLHELIRQYALVKLHEQPVEEAQTLEKHSRYFSNWLAGHEAPLKSARQIQTSVQIRADRPNWISAWRWAVQNRKFDLLRSMVPCLYWYYEIHGYYAEALSTYQYAVSELRAAGAPNCLTLPEEKSTFAFLLDQSGWFEFRAGNFWQSAALFAESLELAREYGDPEVLYHIHGNWGYMALLNGEIEDGQRLTLQSLADAQELGSAWHIAIPTTVLGIVKYQQGNVAQAYQELAHSLEVWRTVGDLRGLVFCMLYLGSAALQMGEVDTAETILQESNAIALEKMDRWAQAFGLDLLGQAAMVKGENEKALERFQNSLALSTEIGDQWGSTQTSIHLAEAQASKGSILSARRLLLEAYQIAWKAKWTPTILELLVAYLGLDDMSAPQTRIAALHSVNAHPAITPQIRQRATRLFDEISSTSQEEYPPSEKSAETWADEFLGQPSL